MSSEWKPRLSPAKAIKELQLTQMEGFCVSRIDGQTTEEELALLTGMRRVEVRALLERLVNEGALEAPPTGDALGAPTGGLAAAQPRAMTVPGSASATTSSTAGTAGAAQAASSGSGNVEAASTASADGDAGGEVPVPEAVDPADAASATDDAAQAAASASHLQRYREQFHPLPVDERAARAATATGADLSALCLDPVPEVIRQVLSNPQAGLEQARLIAANHHTTTGLEFLLARAELMRDAQVQRLLWRNPQLNEGQLRRLTASKRLVELWRLSASREVTSQTRNATMRLLRQRFTTAEAEQRVELIFTSEGRALAGLSGLPIDGKTTALLCARTYSSTMLIMALATWSVTPPALITHLLRQPLVQRQPHLRTRLQQHPNAPSGGR